MREGKIRGGGKVEKVEGKMKGKRKEETKAERERRCRRKMEGSSLGWAWPVLHNTDIH